MTGEPRAEAEREFAHPDIVIQPHGPMLVRGAESIRDEAGTVHPVDRPVVALCRCDKSSRLPWCDGTHKVIPRQ
ncbi:Iron-binding zinc finger protein, CDGSH type [metagenome]|uniref:Iron-binding zinc finger protein, CDGSH type n=1 Tax=metagenome TaxID=256318 RepID=A0A2P2CLA5_9ZZZZ